MSRIELDLHQQELRVGDHRYFYKANDRYDSDEHDELEKVHWFRESTKYWVSVDSSHKGEWLTDEQVDEFQISGEEIRRARRRIKDPEKLRKLNRRFREALPKAKAKQKAKEESDERQREHEEAQQRRYREEVEAMERRREREKRNHGKRRHSDSSDESVKDSEAKSDSVTQRTKSGTKVMSNDNKHYFTIGVWNSTKYENCATIRLSVAGRSFLYTLDKTQFKALRSEISRVQLT